MDIPNNIHEEPFKPLHLIQAQWGKRTRYRCLCCHKTIQFRSFEGHRNCPRHKEFVVEFENVVKKISA